MAALRGKPGWLALGRKGRQAPRRAVSMARQPILDGDGNLVGYELLFRGTDAESAEVLDAEAATSTVILDGLFDVGLSDLVGDSVAYVNVSRDFLLNVRPLPLPPGRVVLELLENQAVDDALLDALEELVYDGYTIALDDFRPTPETERLIRWASIIKIDVLEHPGAELEAIVRRLRAEHPRLTLLAEKVETKSDWVRCRALGFESFQGFYFARPSRLQRARVPTQSLGSLRTIVELGATEDFDELNRIITRDAGLSVRLLRYANSAYVSLPRHVGSVQEGLAWLGAATVKRFAMMVAMAQVHDLPNELLVTALTRARMCQLLSGAGDSAIGDSAFTVGLFSVSDALVDAPMEMVLEQLPLRYDVADALLMGTGRLGELLAATVSYEQGDFAAAAALVPADLDLDGVYRESIAWADRNTAALGA